MIQLVADKQNPAQFFGACGFLELAHYFDPAIGSRWNAHGLEISSSSNVFDEVMAMIDRLQIQPDGNWKGEKNVVPYRLIDNQTGLNMHFDWWYSRTSLEATSIWKCFSGKMTSITATESMLEICKSCVKETTPENIFSEQYQPETGRLGFDPRSSWNAIDAGASINLWKDSSSSTYGFCELLTSVAAQSLPLHNNSKKHGQYHIWEEYYPLPISRLAASGMLPDCNKKYRFERIQRGKIISYFEYAVRV